MTVEVHKDAGSTFSDGLDAPLVIVIPEDDLPEFRDMIFEAATALDDAWRTRQHRLTKHAHTLMLYSQKMATLYKKLAAND